MTIHTIGARFAARTVARAVARTAALTVAWMSLAGCPTPKHSTESPRRAAHGPIAAMIPAGKTHTAPAMPPSKKSPAHRARPVRWTWNHGEARNRARLGRLTPRQQTLLARNGFFLAPQPGRKPASQASHLFHVYERNDYIRFPSFVTVDLAIDVTHAFFDAVLRDLEQRRLTPRLRAALRALVAEAETVRRKARSPKARRQAERAVVFWAVALRLLEQPARGDRTSPATTSARPRGRKAHARARRHTPRKTLTPPRRIRARVKAAVARIQTARGHLPKRLLRGRMDLTQMRPRGHYNRTGTLQRFFRAMSFLGMARFAVRGKEADVPGVTLLARTLLGSPEGRRGLAAIKQVTSFFVGGPDAADLFAAAGLLLAARPGAARDTADALLSRAVQTRFAARLAKLPAPRIQSTASSTRAAPQVRVLGRRAFEDNVALQSIVSALEEAVRRDRRLLTRAPGALGAAALLGSNLARRLLTTPPSGPPQRDLAAAIARGRAHIQRLPASRWQGDAYHATLHSLAPLITPRPANGPRFLRTPAWRLRALQAFSAGWAELRHDTILYGEQSGAECDAPEEPAPAGWVEPVPAVYDRLARMVLGLKARLEAAGIRTSDIAQVPGLPYAGPLARKVKQVVKLLRFLETISRRELAGKLPTVEQRKRLTLVGGEVEWLIISLSDHDLLSKRDQDMAVVADVFTWRALGKAVEVAVAHPDLIYAVVPGPRGPVLARGAVMSYRAFLRPTARRMTDETWRRRLGRGQIPPRPDWLKPIYAEPVPFIRLVGKGVDRCGPSSGATLEL